MRTALERKNINECIIRRDITDSSVEKIKELISTVDWNLITQTLNLNSSSNIFIDKFLKIYNEAFPLQKITIKTEAIPTTCVISLDYLVGSCII